MAQVNEKAIWTETFVAENDLSAKQYYGMEISGDRQVDLIDSATDRPVGVLLNEPEAGQEALVCIVGRCPVKIGSATLTAGQPIMFYSDGTVVVFTPASDITKYCIGVMTIGGTTGVIGEALIQCANPVKGAAST